jgi:hypothetical protein
MRQTFLRVQCWNFRAIYGGYRNRVGRGLSHRPARARICRSFKGTRYRFSSWRAGTKPYLSYWPARLHRLAKSIPRNRCLGSINVYKYGFRPHRLAESIPWHRFLGFLKWYSKVQCSTEIIGPKLSELKPIQRKRYLSIVHTFLLFY